MQNSPNAPLLRLGGGPDTAPAAEDVAIPIALYFKAAWHLRIAVGSVVAAMLLLTTVYLVVRTPVYVASAVIGPPISESNSGLGAGAGLSALSMLAGGQFGGGESTFDKYLQLIQANRLAVVMEERHHVLEHLYSDRWDAKAHSWRDEPGPIGYLKGLVGLGAPPSTELLAERLRKMINVATSGGGGLIELKSNIRIVSLSYTDRQYATELLQYALTDADALAREDELSDRGNRVQYLDRLLQTTSDVDLHQSLTKLLMDQEQNQMLAKVDHHFAFDMIDPPDAPLKPGGLSPVVAILAALVLGLAAAGVLVFFLVQAHFSRAAEAGQDPYGLPMQDPVEAFWRRLRGRRRTRRPGVKVPRHASS